MWVCVILLKQRNFFLGVFILCCTTIIMWFIIMTVTVVDNININIINVFFVVISWCSFDCNNRTLSSGHGESFESEPNECIGNNGYQPPVCCFSLIVSKNISAPPKPWLWSNPVPRCQTIMTIERPKMSAPYERDEITLKLATIHIGDCHCFW